MVKTLEEDILENIKGMLPEMVEKGFAVRLTVSMVEVGQWDSI